jgi:hypothetical protein
MYRRCLFCRADLGSNHALPFTVGTRLAFDGAKGRLWVICPTCARWNLTPLEERWEAIEEAERLYRRTAKRVATDHIGMAQVSDAVQLVRIGEPLRPEFAAWRYGAEFLKRRTRALVNETFSATLSIGLLALATTTGLTALVYGLSGAGFLSSSREFRRGGTRLRLPEGRTVHLFSFVMDQSKLLRQADGGVALQLFAGVPSTDRPWATRLGLPSAYQYDERTVLSGQDMLPALRTLLPVTNGRGARRSIVGDAVTRLETLREFQSVLHQSIPLTGGQWSSPDRQLREVDPAARLALEMALHEADEQAAFTGDLQALEARWREAEEIAAIADDLLTPESVRARLGGARADDGG